MKFPKYIEPDFTKEPFISAPDVKTEKAGKNYLPINFYATTIYPEYFKINGQWKLAEESRMDSCVICREDGRLDVVEQRNVKAGDMVILGRSERCEEGIYLHVNGFDEGSGEIDDQFKFRANRSRETAFARDYQNIYDLFEYERDHGKIVFVMGPACSFDYDSRRAMQSLTEKGYVHGLLAGNADLSEIEIAMRYYAVAHFSKFIPVGSTKILSEKNINDVTLIKETNENGDEITKTMKYTVNQVSYLTPDGKIVTVVVNEGPQRELKLKVDRENMTVYTTTQEKQMEKTYKGEMSKITLPEKSIVTIVCE
jgi:hypothetical protein